MKLIIANWKMNPATLEEAVAFAKDEDHDGLVICPPFPFLEAVGRTIRHATLGAQDAFIESDGAYTGEVSPEELASVGVRYVIVGHSERRKMGETDALIAKKVAAVVGAGLTPILCVGEQRAEHDAGKAEEVVKRQLEIGLSKLINSSIPTQGRDPDFVSKFQSNVGTHQLINLIIAYEPVWAISTEPGAKPDSPENAVSMINFIRETLYPTPLPDRQAGYTLYPRILYGGSVNAENVKGFLSNPEIDGALVGGASLKSEAIGVIMKVARASISS